MAEELRSIPSVPAGTEWLRLTPGQREVLLVLAEQDGTTIKQLEERLVKSSGTLRATLRQLTRMRLIVVELMPSAVGRPAHQYRLSDQAWALFPTNVRAVAQDLMRFLQTEHPAVLAEFIDHARRGIQERACREVRGPELKDRENASFEMYRQLGFIPAWGGDDADRCIALNHCPYWPLATFTDAICGAEIRALSEVLGIEARFIEHRRRGDARCVVSWTSSTAEKPARERRSAAQGCAPAAPRI